MRQVHAEMEMRSSPDKIIMAFLEPASLEAWWAVSLSLIEPKETGVWTLAWDISDLGIRYVMSGIIEKLIPDDYLKISKLVYLNPERLILGPMTLEIRVDRVNEHDSRLQVVQSGYQYGGDWDWYYEAVSKAWPYALAMMKNYLEKD